MNAFQKLVEARSATAEAIKEMALAKHNLENIRAYRDAAPEDIFDLAANYRKAKAKVEESIDKECAAVMAAYKEEQK